MKALIIIGAVAAFLGTVLLICNSVSLRAALRQEISRVQEADLIALQEGRVEVRPEKSNDIVTAEDLTGFPEPVRRYLAYREVIGKPSISAN